MKKLLILLTVLVLLAQAVPFAAIAEGGGTSGPITAAELAAALSLVGYEDDAPSWHDGMQVNGDLTAVQLIQFLRDVQEKRVHTLQNSYTDIENELAALKTEDPAAYAVLTTGENAGMEEYAHTLYRQMEGIRLQLEYWQTTLENQSTAILNNSDKLETPEEYTDYELRLWNERIREATEEVRTIRLEVVSEAETCLERLDRQIELLAGTANDGDPHASRLSGWADAVLHQRDSLIVSSSTSTDSLFPTRSSLLTPLSPISSAEADSSGEAKVHVISDKEIGIRVLDEQGNILPGVIVAVRDTKKTKKPATYNGKTSESEGMYIFPLNGFLMEDDNVHFDMVLSKEGYRAKWMHKDYIKKGSCITVKMEKDSGDRPYIAGCLYDARDCLYDFYTTIYSQANDRVSPITFHVVNPTTDNYVLHMVWQNADGKQYYHTPGRMGSNGEETDSRIIGPVSETDLVMKAKWRAMLKPGGNDYTMRIDGKDVPEKGDPSKRKGVLRLILEKDGNAQAGIAEGAPALRTGSYYMVDSCLQVQKAKLEKPFNKYASIPGLFKPFASLNFSIPIKEGGDWFKSADIGFDIPIVDEQYRKWIPSVSANIDGSFSIFWGIDLSDSIKGTSIDWKNKDARDIDDEVKKKSGFLNRTLGKGKHDVIMDKARQTKGGLNIEKKKGNLGMILGLVGRVNYDANGEKWVSRDLSSVWGLTYNYMYSKTRQFMIGYVPVFGGVQVTASAVFGISIGGYIFLNHSAELDEETFIKSIDYYPDFGGVTLNLNMTITGYAGVGVKGFISASANVSGSFNILLEWIVRSQGNNTLHLGINAGFSFYVVLEAVLVSAKFKIYDHSWPIWDDEWPKEKGTAPSWVGSLFLAGAKADSVPVVPPTLTVDDYPALVPESEKVLDPAASSGNQLEVLEIDGTSYAFRLAPGESGRNRVTWINLNDRSKTGTFEALLEKEDRTLYNNSDLSFCVARAEGFGDPYYIQNMANVHVLTVLSGNAVLRDDGLHLEDSPRLYTLGFAATKDGRLTYEIPRPSFLHLLNWTMLHSVELEGTAEERDELLMYIPSCSIYFRTDSLALISQYSFREAAAIGNYIVTMKFDYHESLPTATGTGNAVRVTADSPACSVAHRDEETPYYAIQKGGKGDQLVLYSQSNGGVIAEAESIPYFRVLPGADTDGDLVFFLSGDKDPYGKEQYHLFSASIQHYALDPKTVIPNPVYTITDLDITIPGAAFRISKVGGTMYLHWLETMEDPQDRNRTVYRLCAVIFDRAAGIATDDMTLAQFSVPDNRPIRNVVLTGSGVGYYTVNESGAEPDRQAPALNSLYSFPLKLVASLDLEAVGLEKDVVSQGDDEYVTIRIKNNGNMAVTKFTMAENMIDLEANDKGDLIQTVHADILHPEKSYLHLEGDLAFLDITGKTVAQRLPVVPDNVTQEYWEVKRTTRTYRGASKMYSEKTETVRLKSAEILPGSLAIFKTLTKIPPTWKGKKLLTFTLTGYSAAMNQLQTMAARSAIAENALLTEADLEIDYTLGSDGKMHPDPVMLTRASDGLTFADSVEPAMRVDLAHDLDNLVVSGTVYRDPDGTRMLRIVLTNDTVDYSSIRLTCEVYLDDSETPYFMDLPYYPEYMSSGCAQTIDIPLSVLARGTGAKKARVVIRGIGIDELTLLDNSFEVDLSENDPLRIIVQPQSQTCAPKETVTMTVKAAGGEPPYRYQWQIWMGDARGWQNIDGATDSNLILMNVTTDMDGRRYRCIVTDQNLDSVISDEAVLTVRKDVPKTGDDIHQALIALLCGTLLLAAWIWISFRRKGQQE